MTGGCPPAVTVRVTAKRLLTRRPDPCRGIVGRRVVPLSRSAPDSGLSRRDPYDVLSRLASRRSEEHTSELQSRLHLVCRLLLEKKKKICVASLQGEAEDLITLARVEPRPRASAPAGALSSPSREQAIYESGLQLPKPSIGCYAR